MIDFRKLYLEEKKRNLNLKNQANNNNDIDKIINIEKEIPIEKSKNEMETDYYKIPEKIELSCEYFNKYKLGSLNDMYYIPEFIDKPLEKELLDRIYNQEYQSKWTQLKKRRLQNWGGNPVPNGMKEEVIPDWLDQICKKIYELGSIFQKKPNHVLLNEYSYDQGIMPHKDGPLFYPVVTILSLSSTCIMDFYKDLKDPPIQQLFLEPRSLLIFTNDAYKTYFHGIKELLFDTITEKVVNRGNLEIGKEIDREIRVSLTIRVVPNSIPISNDNK